MTIRHFTITHKEAHAIFDVLWMHYRTAPKGTAGKCTYRMLDYLASTQQELNYENTTCRRTPSRTRPKSRD